MLKIILTVITLLSSASAYALFDGQLLFGQRSSKFETKSTSQSDSETGTELGIAFHVDPIPFVPVAVGFYYNSLSYDFGSSNHTFMDDFTGDQLGIELMAWTPSLIYDLSLFAKAGYTFYGSYAGENKNYDGGDGITAKLEGEYKHENGTKFGAGLMWSPIAFVSLILEFDYSDDNINLDSIKVDGAKTDFDVDISVKSTSILLGVAAGI